MSIVTLNRTQLHYEVLGRGQPVIFLHGWLGSWRYWWSAMQSLATQHRSFALDLWGFGDSANVASLYSLAAYTDLVAEFIDTLGVTTPVALVGHALGAAVALRFAHERPEAVDRLVCIALPTTKESPAGQLPRQAKDALVKKIFGRGVTFPEISAELHKTDDQALVQLYREVQLCDFTAELARVAAPTLSIYGKRDVLSPVPTANPPGNGFAGSSLHQILLLEDCTHFPMLEAPVVFNRLLLDFLHAGDELTQITPKAYWQRRVR